MHLGEDKGEDKNGGDTLSAYYRPPTQEKAANEAFFKQVTRLSEIP